MGSETHPTAVQDWKQGRRKPGGPALVLLRIADQKPEVFADLS